MSEVIKIRKGLDIKLIGKAEKTIQNLQSSDNYAIKPTDFPGLTPKLVAKVDTEVKIGSPLFIDKTNPEVKFTSPVSGKVVAVNRGERRKILEIVVESDGKNEAIEFKKGSAAELSVEDIKENLLNSGLWPFILQRPYGIVAKSADTPQEIYISGFDSAPLAPDYDLILQNQIDAFQMGIDVLAKLTSGQVHLSLSSTSASPLAKVKNVVTHQFDGPHPAGNVGIQIHHIKPLNKGDLVWTVGPQEVAMIGKLFQAGQLVPEKIVALAGSEVKNPQYYKTILGASIENLVAGNVTDGDLRFVSGNALTGTQIEAKGFMSYYDSVLTVLPEGKVHEFLGWAIPGFGKMSVSRTFFSWLTPNKEYRLNTNTHGGERAFIVTGEYDKVFPMDILPVQLLKAIIIEDIDAMEQLGIYEIVEEDLALCEFVCTSKIEVQSIVREGLDVMVKELG